MALVLSLKEGQDFFVGEERFVLTGVLNQSHFFLRHDGGSEWGISDERSAEVLPNVHVSAGLHPPSSMVRVVIEAPPSIHISRGDRKRKASEAIGA